MREGGVESRFGARWCPCTPGPDTAFARRVAMGRQPTPPTPRNICPERIMLLLLRHCCDRVYLLTRLCCLVDPTPSRYLLGSRADIWRIRADCLVHSTNESLKPRTPAALKCFQIGGARLAAEVQAAERCRTGDALATSAGNLPARCNSLLPLPPPSRPPPVLCPFPSAVMQLRLCWCVCRLDCDAVHGAAVPALVWGSVFPGS